jgi:hypothetical protein
MGFRRRWGRALTTREQARTDQSKRDRTLMAPLLAEQSFLIDAHSSSVHS